jgi:hypothetical protein
MPPVPVKPLPQPPLVRKSDTFRNPPGEDRPGFFDTLPGMIAIALVVAGVVFGGLILFRGPSEDPTTQPLAPASDLPQDAAEYMIQAQKASTDQEACEILDRCVELLEQVSDDAAAPCKSERQKRQCQEQP